MLDLLYNFRDSLRAVVVHYLVIVADCFVIDVKQGVVLLICIERAPLFARLFDAFISVGILDNFFQPHIVLRANAPYPPLLILYLLFYFLGGRRWLLTCDGLNAAFKPRDRVKRLALALEVRFLLLNLDRCECPTLQPVSLVEVPE